jgi:hypothetical protein
MFRREPEQRQAFGVVRNCQPMIALVELVSDHGRRDSGARRRISTKGLHKTVLVLIPALIRSQRSCIDDGG